MLDLYKVRRARMITEQLTPRGINDQAVLAAIQAVPRHFFVQEALWPKAYGDHPVPIECGQTLSQPYIVALMSQLLEATPGMRVLEIGTGSGYQAAVLDAMGLHVFSVERLRELYLAAGKLLRSLRYRNISFKLDDGTLGWPEKAPFDRIMVTAGGPEIPDPLVEQLADPGILLMPVGKDRKKQNLVRLHKENGRLREENMGAVAFVDLVGHHGW